MILIDTSVVVQLLRDDTGTAARNWRTLNARREIVLPRITQLEILQGARDEDEWDTIDDYLEGQHYIELSAGAWRDGARIYFDLRRKGLTVRSVVDCLIAQLAIENKLTLGHIDRDFEMIQRVRPSLRQRRLDLLT